jgi:hypothetical protein
MKQIIYVLSMSIMWLTAQSQTPSPTLNVIKEHQQKANKTIETKKRRIR